MSSLATCLHLCASVSGVLSIANTLLSTNKRLQGNPAAASADPMNKLSLTLLLVFVLGLVAFATWQLFAGNLMASFSTFPFLLITYLFVLRLRRPAE